MGESRRGLALTTAVLVAAFGPYIAGGIRTEQAVVYGLGACLVPFTLPALRLGSTLWRVVATWLFFTVVAVVGTVGPDAAGSEYAAGPLMAGLDNLLLPLIVVATVGGLVVWGGDPVRMLRRSAAVTVMLMCINVVAAIAQSQGATWDAWWTAGGDAVASRASDLGRYGGLVNQPAEAGLLYGVALLAAVYSLSNRPGLLLLVSTVLLYGGLLTASKVFLFALPIFAWQLLGNREQRVTKLILAGVGTVALMLAAEVGWIPEWAGGDHLRTVIPGGDRTLLESLTAGRLGDSSTLEPVLRDVFASSPWFGYGAGGLAVAYDSGWVEAMVVAGVLGVASFTVVLGTLIWAGHARPISAERNFLLGLSLLLAGASIGVPALTVNRAATVVWVLLTLLLIHQPRSQEKPMGPTSPAGARLAATRPSQSPPSTASPKRPVSVLRTLRRP